jgi:hypothetical protein
MICSSKEMFSRGTLPIMKLEIKVMREPSLGGTIRMMPRLLP